MKILLILLFAASCAGSPSSKRKKPEPTPKENVSPEDNEAAPGTPIIPIQTFLPPGSAEHTCYLDNREESLNIDCEDSISKEIVVIEDIDLDLIEEEGGEDLEPGEDLEDSVPEEPSYEMFYAVENPVVGMCYSVNNLQGHVYYFSAQKSGIVHIYKDNAGCDGSKRRCLKIGISTKYKHHRLYGCRVPGAVFVAGDDSVYVILEESL